MIIINSPIMECLGLLSSYSDPHSALEQTEESSCVDMKLYSYRRNLC
jgi:hypothetical protein